jgi:hypothetical protein
MTGAPGIAVAGSKNILPRMNGWDSPRGSDLMAKNLKSLCEAPGGAPTILLDNAGFDKLDMYHVMFDCYKQLKHLILLHCDAGANFLFKIDAPYSNLCALDIYKCHF